MTLQEQFMAFFKCVSLRGHDFGGGTECVRCKAPKDGTTLLQLLAERATEKKPKA